MKIEGPEELKHDLQFSVYKNLLHRQDQYRFVQEIDSVTLLLRIATVVQKHEHRSLVCGYRFICLSTAYLLKVIFNYFSLQRISSFFQTCAGVFFWTVKVTPRVARKF